MSIYLRTLRYFRAYTGQTILALLLMAVSIGLNLLAPWPVKYLIDGVLQSKTATGVAASREIVAHWLGWASPQGAALLLALVLMVITVLGGLVNVFSNALFIKVGLKALLHLRTQI